MIFNGDCLEVMADLPDESVDAIVTDPPAGISFMGKKWDSDKGGRDNWIEWLACVMAEAKRLLKPGGHALVWALPRTSHWTGMAVENAGFEVRDCVYHAFGTGFPKSQNISKAMEKDAAEKYNGYGTALKPAVECWWLVRKPLEEKTIAENVLRYGTGGINIDGCRVPTEDRPKGSGRGSRAVNSWNNFGGNGGNETPDAGRFPANLVHDGSDEVLTLFPHTETGGNASRFFYCAKPSKKEKGPSNDHPTVKPLTLMAYFCRLITPPGGVILDPFMGSGTTGVAAKIEGFGFIGIEQDSGNFNIARERIGELPAEEAPTDQAAQLQRDLFSP